MDNDFSIYWNPATGEFKVYDAGPFWSVLIPLQPLCIEFCDDGFIEFQFSRNMAGEN